ncbi:uncharacterized protein LOC119727994 [Patiria miniata]|uniref:Guanylate cyclase domain-containing protein n=1 Tax=Patiria miniata TaxID=46514 RepID=A0A913ZWH4_PATMI|nr:uncharacterized protein LOC119727994 [Patiria miniata]
MLVSGLPLRNGNRHAGMITSGAWHLLEGFSSFIVPHKQEEKLKLRIGIHSALKIHVSPECRQVLEELGGYNLVERGLIAMKVWQLFSLHRSFLRVVQLAHPGRLRLAPCRSISSDVILGAHPGQPPQTLLMERSHWWKYFVHSKKCTNRVARQQKGSSGPKNQLYLKPKHNYLLISLRL